MAARRRLIGAVSGTLVAAAPLLMVWDVEDTWSNAVASAEQVVGSCHAFATVSEWHALSDVRPSVPCEGPHQTEVVAVRELTGPFAARPTRMSAEERLRYVNELCGNLDVRGYLGAGARDDYGYISVVLRLPTDLEWRRGVRHYRCELVADPEVSGGLPVSNESLRDVLSRPSGDRFRRCWTDNDVPVRCSVPHRSESVNKIVSVPLDRFLGPATAMDEQHRKIFDDWARPLCEAAVGEFLGRAARHSPYHAVAHLAEDGRSFACAVGLPTGEPQRSGTIARRPLEGKGQ